MESYVVRIYRRDVSSPHNLVGLVELIDIDEEKSFTSFDELRKILDRKQGHGDHEEVKSSEEEKGQ